MKRIEKRTRLTRRRSGHHCIDDIDREAEYHKQELALLHLDSAEKTVISLRREIYEPEMIPSTGDS